MTYLGRGRSRYTAADIAANRFTIVLRGMSDDAASHATSGSAEVAAAGLPNYFDDQRFGSVGEPPEFVAKEMVFGRFEHGAVAGPRRPLRVRPRRGQAREGTAPRTVGRLAHVKAELPKGHARSLVDYLVHHPTGLQGRGSPTAPELQGLYLSAYQSYLWNRMLAAWLTRLASADRAEVELKLGRVPARCACRRETPRNGTRLRCRFPAQGEARA